MAEKISTLVLKVDLDCHLCYRKIRKTLCKLQDRENIRSISYDEKTNTVILTGPFDPQKLSKKLCCKAGKVIKDIQIKDTKEKEKEKEKDKPKDQPKPGGSKDKPKESESKSGENGSKKDKPKQSKPAETSQDEATDLPKPADTGKEKPKPQKSEPPSSEPAEKPRTGPVFVVGPEMDYPAPLVWPAGPTCYCRPAYDGHYAGCPCGRAWGQPVYGGPSQFFSEEDRSSCSVM